MGSQRYIAQDLMRHFFLNEGHAHKIADLVQNTNVGDYLSDDIVMLTDEGDLEETLRDLRDTRHMLDNAILNLQAAFTGVRKRPEPLPLDFDFSDPDNNYQGES
jgi:hypothetical protein